MKNLAERLTYMKGTYKTIVLQHKSKMTSFQILVFSERVRGCKGPFVLWARCRDTGQCEPCREDGAQERSCPELSPEG